MLKMFVTLLLALLPIFGGEMHAILLLDTESDDIQEGVKANFDLLLDEFIRIQMYTGLEVHVYPFFGSELEHDILIRIDEIKVQEDDVVFFFCCSHGHRFASTEGPLPVFHFSKHNLFLEQEKITTLLEEKNPRLLISMSDACNSFFLRKPSLLVAASYIDMKSLQEMREYHYQNLYLLETGTMRVCAASPGEEAYIGSEGGVFTKYFLHAFHELTKQPENVSWEEILEAASDATTTAVPFQHPFFDCKK